MSALRSAIEELTGEQVETLDMVRLGDDLVEIETVVGLLEAERARRIHVFKKKCGPQSQGYPSMTAWLKDRCRMAGGRARRLVANARLSILAPRVFRSWSETTLSVDQAQWLLTAADSDPEEFEKMEQTLVEAAADLSVADTRRLIDYWHQAVSHSGGREKATFQEAQRGVSLSQTFDGMFRLDGWLTRTAGETLKTALDALMPPPQPGETRTTTQRRHDALEDLARDHLDHGETPIVGGEKPHLSVVCDLDALTGVAGGTHETESGTVLTVSLIRQLACDSSVSRIVIGPESEVLDVGRKTRVIPAAIRRALVIRDRHCTWKGCDRDARWCDAHHIVHWADGGETCLENLRLLCRFHHTLIHQAHDRPVWPAAKDAPMPAIGNRRRSWSERSPLIRALK
jgi:hypothetical protein